MAFSSETAFDLAPAIEAVGTLATAPVVVPGPKADQTESFRGNFGRNQIALTGESFDFRNFESTVGTEFADDTRSTDFSYEPFREVAA